MVAVRIDNAKNVIERWDELLRALAADPRRQIAISLLDTPPGASVSLPEHAVNPNVPVDPEETRRALRHKHLPLLADLGFVEWGTDPLVASRGPRFDEVAVLFESLYGSATNLPDSLVVGCQRLEAERQGEQLD